MPLMLSNDLATPYELNQCWMTSKHHKWNVLSVIYLMEPLTLSALATVCLDKYTSMVKWNLWWPYSSEHSTPDNLFRANRVADVCRVIWVHSMAQLDFKLNTTCRKFVYEWLYSYAKLTLGKERINCRSSPIVTNFWKWTKKNERGNKLCNNNLRTNVYNGRHFSKL